MKAQYKHFEKEVEEIKNRVNGFDKEMTMTPKETLYRAQRDLTAITNGLEDAMSEVEDEESATYQSLEELCEITDEVQETLDELLDESDDIDVDEEE